jgi:hypothetical protein
MAERGGGREGREGGMREREKEREREKNIERLRNTQGQNQKVTPTSASNTISKTAK